MGTLGRNLRMRFAVPPVSVKAKTADTFSKVKQHSATLIPIASFFVR